MCISFIYKHIRSLPLTRIFTTRDMLIYGKRSAVDASLSRLVKAGMIFRVARGVFVRDLTKRPTVAEIAAAKAKAFGMKIAKHAEDLIAELRGTRKRRKNIFAKNGSSSSFLSIHGRIYMKGTCARKMALNETRVGRIIRALWHIGRRACKFSDVQKAVSNFGRTERRQFWLCGSSMPAWLNEKCRSFFPKLQVVVMPEASR